MHPAETGTSAIQNPIDAPQCLSATGCGPPPPPPADAAAPPTGGCAPRHCVTNLPFGRDATINTGDPIPPNLLNAMQDMFAKGSHSIEAHHLGPLLTVQGSWGAPVLVSDGTAQLPAITSSGSTTGYISLPFSVGLLPDFATTVSEQYLDAAFLLIKGNGSANAGWSLGYSKASGIPLHLAANVNTPSFPSTITAPTSTWTWYAVGTFAPIDMTFGSVPTMLVSASAAGISIAQIITFTQRP